MPVKRLYPYSDVDMLTASHVIARNFMNKIHELSSIMTCWTEEAGWQLIESINYGIEYYLGKQPKVPLYDATYEVKKIMNKAMHDLSVMRSLISNRINHQGNKMLNSLGYQKYYQRARNKDQEALIFLLTTFKEQMPGKIEKKLVSNGVNPELIERIISYRDMLYDANIRQETLKSSTPVMTNERINYFNKIYSEVIGICKIAYSFYYNDPITRELFSFSRMVRGLHASRGKKPEDNEAESD